MRNKLTQDRPTLFVDQYGQKLWASSAKELAGKLGGAKLQKMYVDKKAGGAAWIGYVARHQWLTAYKPVEVAEGTR